MTNGWIQTYMGHKAFPASPSMMMLDIKDIAHSLSMQCRYAGHCNLFYSVAEHSVHIARALPPKLRLWGLLHDAPETYLVDVPRPVKPYLSNYEQLEEDLMKVIAERFYLVWPMPGLVKEYDNRILLDEKAQNLKDVGLDWNLSSFGEPLGVTLQFWSPAEAEEQFLQTFNGIYHARPIQSASESGGLRPDPSHGEGALYDRGVLQRSA